jgi:hypothetical protein
MKDHDILAKTFYHLLNDYRSHTYECLSFKMRCSSQKIYELVIYLLRNGLIIELKKKNTAN